jgi:F1F0 ATPase subunit 2
MNMFMAITIFAGLLLGTFFFGGLWFTVRKGMVAKNPALWFLVSFIIRTAVVLTGFYFIAQSDWKNILFCLGGFLVARSLITMFTKEKKQTALHAEGGNA